MNVVIAAISSDIGYSISKRWLKRGWDIFGTYRTKSKITDDLKISGVKLMQCDILYNDKIADVFQSYDKEWDILILCPGTQEPIGCFINNDFEEWEKSIKVNFTGQINIVHNLLPKRSKNSIVIFFAGCGTNNAVSNYSAYTIGKIALIKMVELLDFEIPDTRFTIIGPGWIKTKIHLQTLNAGYERAGDNYYKTLEKYKNNDMGSMEGLIDFIDYIIESTRDVISGRNFSYANDRIEDLKSLLLEDYNMYKLRRYGNDRKSCI